jgi:hypothetical protein
MSEIPGLVVQLERIDSDYETMLISEIDSQTWTILSSSTLSTPERRVQYYGVELVDQKLQQAPNMTPCIAHFAETISRMVGVKFNSCVVNEYTQKQGISPTIDHPMLGSVSITLSLGENAMMKFERDNEHHSVLLPRRSTVTMIGAARYLWKHSISRNVFYLDDNDFKIKKSSEYRRISLTFRSVPC